MKAVLRWMTFAAVFWPALAVSAEAQWPLGRETPGVVPPSEASISATRCGRFQVFVSPHVKGHTFMLDTDTGRVWIMKKDATSGEYSFQRIPVDDLERQKSPPEPDKTKGGK